MPSPSPSERLLVSARALLPLAMARYSGFHVGAALEDASGGIFPGVNVESVSYGLTQCAERNALYGALARGAREFSRIAVASDGPKPVRPCGACRQVLLEYAPDLVVITEGPGGAVEEIPLRDLLPHPFLTLE